MQVAACRPIRPIVQFARLSCPDDGISDNFHYLTEILCINRYRWKITRLLQAAGLSGWM